MVIIAFVALILVVVLFRIILVNLVDGIFEGLRRIFGGGRR